jgi:drug/metabolite transporter (DMT)-like permease
MYFILIPILGALALATLTLFEKIVLRKRSIDTKTFTVAGFISATIVMLPLIYFFWKLSPEALHLKNIFIFSLIIISAIISNLCLFYAIKWEKITHIEPAIIMEPLFTILFALGFSYIFGTALFERNFSVIIPAIIAAIALVFAHVRKHHLDFNKYFIAAIIASFFFAFELVLSRLILDFYTPISFYFLRCTSISLVTLIFFKHKFSKLNTKVRFEILLVGALWVAYRVLVYYGYLTLGVIFTTLMLMLGPVFVYIFANKFLKEKLDWKNILSAVIIVICVVYAVLI